MKFTFHVANRIENFEIDNNIDVTITSPTNVLISDELRKIENAVTKPILTQSLDHFLKDKQSILIIVNDATRATPTSTVLSTIFPYIKNKNNRIIIATGAHRNPNEDELRRILGRTYPYLKDKIMFHKINTSELVYLGNTSRLTEVYINKVIKKVDGVIVIGSTEPHYFAGYTGGRKGIVPGIAGYTTIEQNHKFALQEGAQVLKLKGNPVHEDLVEAVELVTRDTEIFCINTVSSANQKIYAVTAGDIFESHYASIPYSNEIFVKSIDKEADIAILLVQPPLDINLYQAHKALENAKFSVKDNGTMILVASCWDGIGARNFYDLFLKISKIPNLKKYIEENYKLGYHMVIKFLELMKKAKIFAVSDLDGMIFKKIGIEPFADIDHALKAALNQSKDVSHILIINDAAMVVPIPKRIFSKISQKNYYVFI